MNKYTYLIVPFLLVLTGCSINYTGKMKVVAEPMQQKLVTFYQEKKRFPSVAERNRLLTESGCSMTGDTCRYSRNDFLVQSDTHTYNLNSALQVYQEYRMKITLEKSRCHFGLIKAGQARGVSCYQDPYIRIKQ